MLNYIWLSLIIIGIGVALWGDVRDLSTDRYHNDAELTITINISSSDLPLEPQREYQVSFTVNPREYERVYGHRPEKFVVQRGKLVAGEGNTGTLLIAVDDRTPPEWKERLRMQKNSEHLIASVRWEMEESAVMGGHLRFDPIRFVRMNSVTNDGVIRYARTAVELAIGLIGIMALWLGIMKIAEQSGLVATLASALKPITTRLFPDVPGDHPAMGAMIMNMSANMLGLANAATPLGLKAMEELNKLNRKLGTATDAMCTFLVINTSSVQLIPATVIALRAAAGSTNPTEILGPVIVATTVNTIVGILTVKLLARLPVFRRQIVVEEQTA